MQGRARIAWTACCIHLIAGASYFLMSNNLVPMILSPKGKPCASRAAVPPCCCTDAPILGGNGFRPTLTLSDVGTPQFSFLLGSLQFMGIRTPRFVVVCDPFP